MTDTTDIDALVKWLRSMPTLREEAGKWIPCPDPTRQFNNAADALERQQAVVEAARGNKVNLSAYRSDLHVYANPGTLSVALHVWSGQQPEIGDYSKTLKIGALYIESIWETLAALDAPPEGDGTKGET